MSNLNDRNDDNMDKNDFKMFEGNGDLDEAAERLRRLGMEKDIFGKRKRDNGENEKLAKVEFISRLHRDALEGSHLVITGENVVDFTLDYFALLGRRRMVALIEGLRTFKGVGVGYYQGGLAAHDRKKLNEMLEEVERRKFIKTLLLVDVLNEMDLETISRLDDMIRDGVQVIYVMSDNVEVDEDKRWLGEELIDMLKNHMRTNYRWGRDLLFNNGKDQS